MQTVRYARVHVRHTRSILVRLDPALSQRPVWTLYGHAPGKRGGLWRYGRVGTGR